MTKHFESIGEGLAGKREVKLTPTEGAKWDDGKVDWSYLPSQAVAEVLKVYAGGAKKYGRGNYLKGIHFSRVFSAAMRHLWAWWRCEDKDEESGLSHLAHAAWNILTLLEYVVSTKYGDFDDRKISDEQPYDFNPKQGTVSIPSVWTPDPNGVTFELKTSHHPEGVTYVYRNGEIVQALAPEVKHD